MDKNTKKIIIDSSESHFDIELRKKLENIRYFLDKQDLSIYFFELQKLMYEQIIKFLSWENKTLKFNNYSNLLLRKMNLNLTKERSDKYLNFVQKVNLYRNILSKEVYYELMEFIDIINLILNKKSL